jgi:hypothetical protein
MNSANNIPAVKSTETRVTPTGAPWIVYTVAHRNCGGEYRITVRRLHDLSWSISAAGKAEAILSREPTPEEACAWFAVAPARDGYPRLDLSPARR